MLTPSQLLAALSAGHDAADVKHATEEAAKLGHLRGGSVGVVLPDGSTAGKCPRLAHLRTLGLQPPLESLATRNMFALGYANEDIVEGLLRAGLDVGLTVLSGADTAFSYTRPDGRVVSCRADLALAKPGGGTVQGLELKAVCSLWTALGVAFDLRPKSDHLIQAAHYSAKQGKIPFLLLYSSRVEWHVSTAPRFIQDKFAPGHPLVKYKDNGVTPLKIRPFDVAYALSWGPEGKLYYWTDGMATPCVTTITEATIDEYYSRVVAIGETQQLPPRPSSKSVDGSKGFNPCDYCDLVPVCNNYERDYQAWMDHAQVVCTKGREDGT